MNGRKKKKDRKNRRDIYVRQKERKKGTKNKEMMNGRKKKKDRKNKRDIYVRQK